VTIRYFAFDTEWPFEIPILAAVRTDLDTFNEIEARALVAAGYHTTRHELLGEEGEGVVHGFSVSTAQDERWEFLQLREVLGDAEKEARLNRVLALSKNRLFKAWRYWPSIGLVCLLALLVTVGSALHHFFLVYLKLSLVELSGITLLITIGLAAAVFVLRYVPRFNRIYATASCLFAAIMWETLVPPFVGPGSFWASHHHPLGWFLLGLIFVFAETYRPRLHAVRLPEKSFRQVAFGVLSLALCPVAWAYLFTLEHVYKQIGKINPPRWVGALDRLHSRFRSSALGSTASAQSTQIPRDAPRTP
jgi:hypothetical protein